ncbi:MAG: 3-oxo-5-alpha-steroid 4-dehydrogenase [Myxococcales bacterium]|nr:3-oxo-5-alpha-steroid 4-dehydrogenase [Myxococcales bacterium]
MSEIGVYKIVLWGWIALAPLTLGLLLFVSAPYGRHSRDGWGPSIGRTGGWILMESPALWAMPLLYLLGDRVGELVPTLLLAAWLVHYSNRVLIFPLRMRGGNQRNPLLIVAFAFFFNLVNAYLQGRWLFALGPALPRSWLADPRFVAGALLMAFGFATNLRADAKLRALRARGDGYHIPRGGLFELVSCANYLGEIIEWIGWALCTWSLAGLSFALWTVANLLPRALAHHRFYQQRFADYPARRRAIIPYVL